jgi:hypothetical protein
MNKTLKLLAITIIAVSVTCSEELRAQDAASILAEAVAKDTERKKDVSSYVVTQSLMGQQNVVYFKRVTVESENGDSYEMFRTVPASQMQGDGQQSTLTAEQGEAFAQGLENTGSAMSSEIENGLKDAGLPPKLFSSMGSPDEPWASPDPSIMMGSMAQFMRAAGGAQARVDAERAKDNAEADGMIEFASKAKLIGEESVDGVNTYHLLASDLEQTQKDGAQEFTIQTVSLWIDKNELVPLKMRMEGVAEMDGETRPVFMERISSDYRKVPESAMYESYKQVMRMGGVMDAKQEKQMAEAQVQLAEFDKQLADMPASQRQMMENMMGDQIKMMRSMVSSGAFEIETTIDDIRVISE